MKHLVRMAHPTFTPALQLLSMDELMLRLHGCIRASFHFTANYRDFPADQA